MLVRVLDGVDAFLDQIGSVDFLPLALAIGCHLLKMACTSRAWRNVLAAAYPENRVPWVPIYGAYLAGVGINAIIPARAGDAVRIVLAHRAIPGSTYTTVVSSTLVLSFFDMFAASLFLGWALSTDQLPGLDVLARFESFDFAWILARPLLLDLVIAGVIVAAGVLGFWIAGHVADFRERVGQAFRVVSPPTRYLGRVATGRRGLEPAHPDDLVPPRRVQHPADVRERGAHAGVVERRDAVPDHAGRHRNRAGVPALRAERRRLGVGAPRVQRRREAHPHAHERRRGLHGDRADAANRQIQEGSGAAAGGRRVAGRYQ